MHERSWKSSKRPCHNDVKSLDGRSTEAAATTPDDRLLTARPEDHLRTRPFLRKQTSWSEAFLRRIPPTDRLTVTTPAKADEKATAELRLCVEPTGATP